MTGTAVYVCAFGCDTVLSRIGPRYLTGDPRLPYVVCSPGCPQRPEGAEVYSRDSLDVSLIR